MPNVNKISSGIMSATSKALGKFSKSKPMRWVANEFQKNPEKALAYTTVASIIAKDGVGCYKYVTQSMNNKDIPKERRTFVASLDLTNGLLMILAQIGMFALMRKYSEPAFNKIFGKTFNEQNAKNIMTRVRMKQKSLGLSSSKKMKIDKDYQDVRKGALESFKFVSEIAAATIVGKRIIVPFIATPIAGMIKEKMEEHMPKYESDEATEAEKA